MNMRDIIIFLYFGDISIPNYTYGDIVLLSPEHLHVPHDLHFNFYFIKNRFTYRYS